MRWGLCLVFAALAISFGACSRSGAASHGPGAPPDPNLGPVVSEDGLFSFQAPKGWTVERNPQLDYPTCVGPRGPGGDVPSIVPGQEGYESVDTFADAVTSNTGDVRIVDKSRFATHQGTTGERIVARKGVGQEVVIYAFAGKNGLLLTFTGSCAPADDDRVRPMFDASMRSLVLEK